MHSIYFKICLFTTLILFDLTNLLFSYIFVLSQPLPSIFKDQFGTTFNLSNLINQVDQTPTKGIYPVGINKLTYLPSFPPQKPIKTDSIHKVVFSTIDKSENFLHMLSQKETFQRMNYEMSDFYDNESTENLANGVVKGGGFLILVFSKD